MFTCGECKSKSLIPLSTVVRSKGTKGGFQYEEDKVLTFGKWKCTNCGKVYG